MNTMIYNKHFKQVNH